MKKLIFAMMFLMVLIPLSSGSLTDGIVSYYKLDGTTGVVVDELGTNNGTNDGATRGVTGKINNSFAFNNNKVSFALSESFYNSNFSIGFWINASTWLSDDYIFYAGNSQVGIHYYNSTHVAFQIDDGTPHQSISEISTGSWEYYVVTRDVSSGGMKIYRNGILKDTNAFTGNADSDSEGDARIGDRAGVGGAGMVASFDEMGMWSKILTQAEISDLYNSGTGESYPFAKVVLNSPTDNYISPTFNVLFNATGTASSGNTIANMSLYTNETGTWGIRNTTFINNLSGNLLSEYRFEESAGNLLDSVGNYNLTSINGDPLRQQPGAIDYAYTFIPNDWISGTSFNPNSYGSLSFNVWVKYTSAGMIYRFPESGSWGNVHLEVESATSLSFVFGCGTSNCAGGGSPLHGGITIPSLDDGNFHMLTATHGGGDKLYLDGVSIANFSSGTISTSSTNLYIGTSSGGLYYGGTIDEFTSFDKVLSNEEILSLYNSGNAQRPSSSLQSPQTWTRTLTDTTLWNVEMCENDGTCIFAPSNRTLTIDQSSPTISVESPDGTIVYNKAGGNETLNITFTDTNLDSCWYDYNGTNTTIDGCLSGVKNSTNFVLQSGVYNMTIYTNDTVGNNNSQFINWSYTAFEESTTAPSTILVGDPGDFSILFTLSSGTTINSANLIYNSTAYSVSIDSLGSNQYNLSRTLNIPEPAGTILYYFNLSLSTGDSINTTSNTVTVSSLAFDDCSSYTNVLYNFTMYDEHDLSILNSSGDSTNASLNLQMYSVSTGEEIANFSKIYTTTNPFKICMENPLTSSSDNKVNVQVQYKATGYAEEFYHIRGDILTDTDMNTTIPLYSLINTSSQIFTIKYLDSSFTPVPNAVVQVQRLYVGEGISRTVEQPLTDSSGETLAHLEVNDVIYTFTILVDNSVDAVFNNVVAICQNPTFEDCEIELLAVDSFVDVFDFSTVGELIFTGPSYDKNTRTVSTSYNVRDGTTKTISLNVTLFDALGTTEVCSTSDTASAGTISCVVPVSFGNTTVIATLYADGVKTAEAVLNLARDPSDIYGSNLVWVGMVIFISFLGIGMSGNPIVTGLFLIISSIVLVFMNVIYSTGWIGGGATILWFIIAVILIIIKGSKRA